MQKDYDMSDTLHEQYCLSLAGEDGFLVHPAGYSVCSVFELFNSSSLETILDGNYLVDNNMIGPDSDSNEFYIPERI